MFKYICFYVMVITYSMGCSVNQTISQISLQKVQLDTTLLFDSLRQRSIPIAIYQPQKQIISGKQPLIIISHGYGQNKGGDYLVYSYLSNYLAAKGYLVASIQHELPTDSLLPLTGIPQVVRRPFWERGADNILFVLKYLQKKYPNLDFNNVALIGHSNGGDMTALFPQKYPDHVAKIITLDNRRMALPKNKYPAVLSIRSSDQAADEGVLPTETEERTFNIRIIKLVNTIHNNMDDSANEIQRNEIRKLILDFLVN
jgi:dienelactone hydrolase